MGDFFLPESQYIELIKIIFSIWSNALEKDMPCLDVTEFGWVKDGDVLKPNWTSLNEASKACMVLVKCGCKQKCSKRCKCKKHGLPCTDLCLCSGGCAD